MLLGPDGTVLYASQSTQPVLGYGATENVGLNAFELVHPDDRPDAMELFGELMQRPGTSSGRSCALCTRTGAGATSRRSRGTALGRPGHRCHPS